MKCNVTLRNVKVQLCCAERVQQKEKEGDAPEELLPPDFTMDEYYMSAYKRALTWGDWNKEGYVAP